MYFSLSTQQLGIVQFFGSQKKRRSLFTDIHQVCRILHFTLSPQWVGIVLFFRSPKKEDRYLLTYIRYAELCTLYCQHSRQGQSNFSEVQKKGRSLFTDIYQVCRIRYFTQSTQQVGIMVFFSEVRKKDDHYLLTYIRYAELFT